MTNINRQEGVALLAQAKADFEKAVENLQAIADKYDLDFSVNFAGLGTTSYVPKGIEFERPDVEEAYDFNWRKADELRDAGWDGQFAGWQNSSSLC